MAFSPSLAKEWYQNLSVKELEKKYKALTKDYYFNTKEEEINSWIKNYLNASDSTNTNSTRIALEELLKEKTGREYKIERKNFNITLIDIINFVANQNKNTSLATLLVNFFQKHFVTNQPKNSSLAAVLINFFKELTDISEEEKIEFLIKLVQNKDYFEAFIKEITQNTSVQETYAKYKVITQTYVSMHSKIG